MSHLADLRPLRTGLRALFYRGRHHKRSATAASLVLFSAVYLR